jgi:hypothetical protein
MYIIQGIMYIVHILRLLTIYAICMYLDKIHCTGYVLVDYVLMCSYIPCTVQYSTKYIVQYMYM